MNALKTVPALIATDLDGTFLSPDGSVSEPFVYDETDRRAIDAVVIVPHFAGSRGERRIYLRSSLRPPLLPTPRLS